MPDCSIKGLIRMGVVPTGEVEDVLGNVAILNFDGTVTLDDDNVGLSFTRSARVHNMLVNDVDRRVDPWRYWFVVIDGHRVPLGRLRMIVEYTLPLERIFEDGL